MEVTGDKTGKNLRGSKQVDEQVDEQGAYAPTHVASGL